MYICEACGTDISIHALREEGDRAVSRMPSPYSRFLSTPSARKATHRARPSHPGSQNFYPRPPRGRRHVSMVVRTRYSRFLSTPSARKATPSARIVLRRRWNFYPRPPRGRRHDRPDHQGHAEPISIHALREEGDRDCAGSSEPSILFLSTPSARKAT